VPQTQSASELLAVAIVVLPVGQLVQVPPIWYEPVGQVGPVEAVHEDDEVLPASDVNPLGHEVQSCEPAANLYLPASQALHALHRFVDSTPMTC
jgi:hypothetical protein